MPSTQKHNHQSWITSVLVALVMVMNAWVLMAVREGNQTTRSTRQAIMEMKVDQATYHERVDSLQEAQRLTYKLVMQVQADVQRHEYVLKSMSRELDP